MIIYADYFVNIGFLEKCQREFVPRMARPVTIPSLVQISSLFLETWGVQREKGREKRKCIYRCHFVKRLFEAQIFKGSFTDLQQQ